MMPRVVFLGDRALPEGRLLGAGAGRAVCSATAERPGGLPEVSAPARTVLCLLAIELAVGAMSEEDRFLTVGASEPEPSTASLLIVRVEPVVPTPVPPEPEILRFAPMDVTGPLTAETRLLLVPSDDAPAMELGRTLVRDVVDEEGLAATLVLELAAPSGGLVPLEALENDGMGARTRAMDCREELVEAVFLEAVVEFDACDKRLEAVPVVVRAVVAALLTLTLSAPVDCFRVAAEEPAAGLGVGAGCGACAGFATGTVEDGCAAGLVSFDAPAPMFHTLRTRDLADARNPKRDVFAFPAGGLPPILTRPLLLRLLALLASSLRRIASRSFCFFRSSASGSAPAEGASETL